MSNQQEINKNQRNKIIRQRKRKSKVCFRIGEQSSLDGVECAGKIGGDKEV